MNLRHSTITQAKGVYTFPNQIVVDDELVDVKGTIEYKLGDTFEN